MYPLQSMGSKLRMKFRRYLWHFTQILNPYIAKYAFYGLLFLFLIYNISELWRHKHWWDVPIGMRNMPCDFILSDYSISLLMVKHKHAYAISLGSFSIDKQRATDIAYATDFYRE